MKKGNTALQLYSTFCYSILILFLAGTMKSAIGLFFVINKGLMFIVVGEREDVILEQDEDVYLEAKCNGKWHQIRQLSNTHSEKEISYTLTIAESIDTNMETRKDTSDVVEEVTNVSCGIYFHASNPSIFTCLFIKKKL